MNTNSNDNVISKILTEVRKVVFGMEEMTELVAYAIFAKGHIELVGVPGVSKTHTAKAFGRAIKGAGWSRFQMTPNTMPADIVGTRWFNKETNKFEIEKGRIFSNIVLADEINRTTPRTQSALLEAMGEGSTTIAGQTFKMDPLFTVLATANPIEQEGTYPLPEAQLDRFLFQVNMGYAPRWAEKSMILNQKILKSEDPYKVINAPATADEIIKVREDIENVFVHDAAIEYILDLTRSSRPGDEAEYKKFIEAAGADGQKFAAGIILGAGPRAQQAITGTAQVRAYHMGRDYILPEDIQFVLPHILGHRFMLSRKAKMEKKYTTLDAVNTLVAAVPFFGKDDPSKLDTYKTR